MSRSKAYKKIREQVSTAPVQISEAVDFIKEHARKTFDETIELHINLGVDKEKSEQNVRGSVMMPSGSPKKQKIAVFVAGAAEQKAASEAGATVVGGEELIEKIMKDGFLEADIVLATPAMMQAVAKAARVLGPIGLMPNPKNGTITDDITKAIQELQQGKLSFKMDQSGNIHEAIGKASWDNQKISDNIAALLAAVQASRPDAIKGSFIKHIVVKSTMGPAIDIEIAA